MVGGYVLEPEVGSLFVALQTLFLAALEHGNVQVIRVELQHVHQVFPGHVDGSLLEVVAEAPVAQHLEHGVVVGIVAHFLQIVVLAAHAQTLLTVGTTAGFGVARAQDDVLPGHHTGVDKHKGGVIFDNHGCAGHDGMSFRFKKLFERIADFVSCHHDVSIIIY